MPYYYANSGMHSHRHPFYGYGQSVPDPATDCPKTCAGHGGIAEAVATAGSSSCTCNDGYKEALVSVMTFPVWMLVAAAAGAYLLLK